MPSYKSFCWSLGTTSFRMVEFNRKIEEQLNLLNQFWMLPQYHDETWRANKALQTAYYNFIKEAGFIEDREAPRKDKDAREKTSGLVFLGLIDDERRLTQAGNKLLEIAESGNFESDNFLHLPSDSFIYFKQLLKAHYIVDDETVRPYLVLAYVLSNLGEISKSEFTYLLPLATNPVKTDMIVDYIGAIRNGRMTIDDAIISVLFAMDNYRAAKEMFLSEPITENLIMEIGMNRKSQAYDKPYFGLYNALYAYHCDKDDDHAIKILRAVNGLSGKCCTYWKQLLFNTSRTATIQKEGASAVNNIQLFRCINERDFKEEFFKLLHLFKAKSLLSDYSDLNRRYLKTSDTFVFKDDLVRFDIIPSCYFDLIKDNLLDIAFIEDRRLQTNCEVEEINLNFSVSQEQLFIRIENKYGVQVRSLYDIQDFVDRDRYNRFNQMIDEKFTDDVLIDLMTKFENRNDNEIQDIVTNNADIPTIFEYVLAIAWYKISGRHGKILEYMNLSLDADLLPVTHAAGGHEDITYKYEATDDYPSHTLLIEATLASGTNQRRMEMEPVSRHLGDYLLSHAEEAYCLFATTVLDINVISDFRLRRNGFYYSRDGAKCVRGLKIIPFQTSDIKTIILKKITYSSLYSIFQTAYLSEDEPNIWYKQRIIELLK